MKSATVVCAFVVLACLCLQDVNSKATVECPPEALAPLSGQCAKVVCYDDGSRSGVGCGTYQCAPGKQTGYRDDDVSKPYPECCGGPICAP